MGLCDLGYTWFEAFSEEGRGLHTRAAYTK